MAASGSPDITKSPCNQVPSALADDLSWLLARAAQGVRCLVEQALPEVDMPVRTYAVLRFVAETGSPSQQAIARATAIDKTTLVQVIDDLEKAGLCTRRPDPLDRRARLIEATDLGGRRLAEANEVIQSVEAGVLPKAERAQLTGLLRQLLSHPIFDCATTGSCI